MKLARLIALQLLLVVVTLAGAELLLRLIAPTILLEPDEKNLFYRYDPELGWFPVANASGKFSGEIEYTVHQNSLGLRDDEYGDAKNGTIMFLGDSFVWGLDAEQDKRFTNILQRAFPDYRIVSAGVSGFGTDQEYLMLRRLWDRLNPTTVVLIFCSDNDRGDNSHNLAYQGYYKPYFAVGPRGAELHGLPIPISWRYYWKNEWFNRHFAVARLMTDLYIRLRHPRINVPDPTKSLVTLIRQFVVDHGARFAVGIEGTDAKLAAFLRAQSIPFVSLDGAERFSNDPYGQHWTAKGQVFVATRMEEFLPQIGAVASPPQRPVVADQAKPTR